MSMEISFQKILGLISIWSIILPLLSGAVFIRWLSRDSLIILGVVVAATIPQVVSKLVKDDSFTNITYNSYTVLEFLLLSVLLVLKINSKKNKMVITGLFIFFLLIILFSLSKFSMSQRFLNEWVCYTSIVYTFGVLLFLLEQYFSDNISITTGTPFFWYLSGIFFYAPCTLIVFSLWSYLKKNPSSALSNIWIIHHVFNTLLYFSFATGMVIDFRNKYLSKSSVK